MHPSDRASEGVASLAEQSDVQPECIEPMSTDYCPRCERVVDVFHEPLQASQQWDVVCAYCQLIIDVVSRHPQEAFQAGKTDEIHSLDK